MDFASVHTVAILPFWNLSKDPQGADRVRDVFTTALLATNAVYVVPTGEVARAVSRIGIASPVSPAADEVVKLCAMLKADAVITGVLREYGEVRSASATANVVALSLQMQEAGVGKVVWSGSSTKGGVGWSARLLGSAGGDPVNDVTEHAVDDLLRQLFKS
ncbi:MAG TPA: GNA1162 family protein, partial [Anaeromyxobacteraceae bacterium]